MDSQPELWRSGWGAKTGESAAAQFLHDTTLNVEKTGRLVGNATREGFHRAFRKRMGVTPAPDFEPQIAPTTAADLPTPGSPCANPPQPHACVCKVRTTAFETPRIGTSPLHPSRPGLPRGRKLKQTASSDLAVPSNTPLVFPIRLLFEMNSVPKDDRPVEAQARFRTIPLDELLDGVVVCSLAAPGRECVKDSRLGLFQVRQSQDPLGWPPFPSRFSHLTTASFTVVP
jgi:hypothetical protein